ncbi:senescence-associated carboxylesterase 101-like isoform X2 [Cicer arietinum]|uniref:Senescence-associated carboxylesterase 101-like isoform X2 n=1 Tax=Cicer arietinum TaxID=3827 RepID=A0A1S2Y704_CICAR|nr:senescence-associated carboxylesterase 101-like isoform X2 [Cicer arietinum]
MAQSKLFCGGIEVASFVTSSRILYKSWSTLSSHNQHDAVSYDGVGLSWKLDQQSCSDFTILAFKASLDSSSNLQADLVSSSDLREDNFLDFDFLCSRKNPIFFLYQTAVTLFRQNHHLLDSVKSQINSSSRRTPLIVTGHGLGGSIACLFIISLLHSIGSGKNRPLCITFGSPLVGDKRLQQAISQSSIWNSCFIHIVSHKDPLPRLFISNRTSTYTPFGTFIICSDATSFENPDSTLEILVALASVHDNNQGLKSFDYGNIVKNLYLRATCIDFSTQADNMTNLDSLATGISLQLQALGLTPHMQQQENIDINTLETELKGLEERFILQKRILFDPSKKLNDMKVHMAHLEWYKKEAKNQQIGYYDSYKNMNSPFDHDVVEFHKKLTIYWEKMVEEVEMKPQREGSAFRTRWLYGGTTYRRMVEPLAIAQYYRDGGRDYVNKKRSKHFKKLEGWLMEESKNATSDVNNTRRNNVEAILTIDSCFWAHVEEALILCRELKVVKEKEETLKKLFEYEEYVYQLLKDYAVSPDIFLSQSSYICWWNEYKAIKGSSYTSTLANFMNDYTYIKQYFKGAYDFP